MDGIFAIALANLTSPMVLFFALGLAAALVRSDLAIPEAVAKGLSIYLVAAIGFKGGVELSATPVDLTLGTTLVGATLLSFAIPFIAWKLLERIPGVSVADRTAIAACAGSISIVTFLAGSQMLTDAGIPYEGYMIAAAAVMEAPAIVSALWLAGRAVVPSMGAQTATVGGAPNPGTTTNPMADSPWREVLTNGSVVLLLGAFAIGLITGKEGLDAVAPLMVEPFKGVLCIFLLDMGILAGQGLREQGRALPVPLIGFGMLMPVIGAIVAAPVAALTGLSVGGAALLIILSASASYIAVPAAMRIAVPDARPGVYLTLSLGVTFPFNLVVGLPLYLSIAQWIA